MSTKDVLMEIEQEVECHLQCSVVEQLWSDYSLNSYYKHREE
jgi:hypothetical protein